MPIPGGDISLQTPGRLPVNGVLSRAGNVYRLIISVGDEIVLYWDNNEVKYLIGDSMFTWDADKAEANFKKHGVTFELAAEVFFDENYLESEERRDGETRFKILGVTFSAVLLFVVFAERMTFEQREVYRIISARKATATEGKQYGAQVRNITGE
jgi:uncharacterized DUF497 family protein